MRSNNKHIFERQDPLSKEELDAYLHGRLSGDQLKRVEKKLADSSLEAEALEGLSNDPDALNSLPSSNELFNSGTVSNNYKKLFWTSTFIAVIAIVALLFTWFNPIVKEPETGLNNQIAIQKISPDSVPITEQLIAIEQAEPLEVKEQITYEKMIADQPKTISESNTTETQNNVTEAIQPEKVEEKEKQNITIVQEDKVARSNVKFIYLHELKVIDYSELYTGEIKKTELILTGTPANLSESGGRNETETETRTILIPYKDFLKETMFEFSQNHYKSALKNFTIILQHYPEDLNAHFYGGLCYYNLGKFDKAIAGFEKCINNSFSTFEEEAQWYKAISLNKTGKKSEAESLLNEIITNNGFYSEKARKMLNQK